MARRCFFKSAKYRLPASTLWFLETSTEKGLCSSQHILTSQATWRKQKQAERGKWHAPPGRPSLFLRVCQNISQGAQLGISPLKCLWDLPSLQLFAYRLSRTRARCLAKCCRYNREKKIVSVLMEFTVKCRRQKTK